MFMTTIRGTTYTANTLAGLSAAYCLARDESGEGASTFPLASVYVMDRGTEKTIGHFSCNGRVWPNVDFQEGISPLYDPATDPVPDMLAAMNAAESDLMAYCEGLYKKGPRMAESFAAATKRLAAVRDAIAKAEGAK